MHFPPLLSKPLDFRKPDFFLLSLYGVAYFKQTYLHLKRAFVILKQKKGSQASMKVSNFGRSLSQKSWKRLLTLSMSVLEPWETIFESIWFIQFITIVLTVIAAQIIATAVYHSSSRWQKHTMH